MHIILAAPKIEKIQPLLQSEGFVIGVDKGALIAVKEKIPLDVALGDFDSIVESEQRQVVAHADKVLSYQADKDDTDAELALAYVQEYIEPRTIYVYNWQGGRADHLYSLFMLVLQDRFLSIVSKIRFISKNNEISYYQAGDYRLTKKTEMDYLSFIILTQAKNITLKNVKYPLVAVDYQSPRALISNEFLGQSASLSFESGVIAAIQSRDAE